MYLKSASKCNSFTVAIGIKIPFCRVLVTIEPGCFLLQFVTANCLIGRDLFSYYNSIESHIDHWLWLHPARYQFCNVIALENTSSSFPGLHVSFCPHITSPWHQVPLKGPNALKVLPPIEQKKQHQIVVGIVGVLAAYSHTFFWTETFSVFFNTIIF